MHGAGSGGVRQDSSQDCHVKDDVWLEHDGSEVVCWLLSQMGTCV